MKKIEKIALVLILSCLASSTIKAQEKVFENKDPSIDTLISVVDGFLMKIPTTTLTSTPNNNPNSKVNVMGYRVQIYVGSDRKKAYDVQSRFMELYPSLNTYISYKQPNYRLKVGDFATREQAQILYDALKPNFPTLFIFREEVTMYRIETTDNDPEGTN